MLDLMQKGGPLMWLLFPISVLAVAVFIERFIYLHRSTISTPDILRGLADCLDRFAYTQDGIGKSTEALQTYREEVCILEPLVRDGKTIPGRVRRPGARWRRARAGGRQPAGVVSDGRSCAGGATGPGRHFFVGAGGSGNRHR